MEPRAYESGAAGTPPKFPASAVTGFPTAATTTMPATEPGPYWFYMVGEEMRNAIAVGGIAPSPYDNGQLLKSITNLRLSGGG